MNEEDLTVVGGSGAFRTGNDGNSRGKLYMGNQVIEVSFVFLYESML